MNEEISVFYDLACERVEGEDTSVEKSDTLGGSQGRFQIHRGEDEKNGRYAVFFTQELWWMDDRRFFELREKLAEELLQVLSALIERQNDDRKCLLVAGLGNPQMTADALGAEVVKRVTVTRKIPSAWGVEQKGSMSVAAIATGVLGTTGIGTVEHLRGVCDLIRPDAVLAVDALSAKSRERLGRTVQISTAGISPGAGVDSPQTRVCYGTLGVPVISLGVPTVIRSSEILREAFLTLGVEQWTKAGEFLQRESDFFVMPKECDLLLRSAATLLASAIDCACRNF